MTMASNISEEPEIVINVEQQEEEEHAINIGSIEQAHPEDTYTPIVATVDDPEINFNITNTDEHQHDKEESPNKVQVSSTHRRSRYYTEQRSTKEMLE